MAGSGSSKSVEAVDFLINDQGDVGTGFRGDFAADKPCRSVLQRNDKVLSEVLEIFDWKDDSDKWVAEYSKGSSGGKSAQDVIKLVRYRRGVCFLVGGWREFNEDFGRGDVSCLRDIRTPLVTSRSPLKAMKDDFNEK